MVISDIILDGELPASVAESVYAYVGCVSGAMQREQYFGLLRDVGLGEVEVLKDVDYLFALAAAAPGTLETEAAPFGIDPAALKGKVRSVTYRATKPL